MDKRVLVTAVGGDIGFSIGTILRRHFPKRFLLGCDVHDDHAGSTLFDQCLNLPKAYNPGYIDHLKAAVRHHGITHIIPTSEPELRFFTAQNIETIAGVPLIMANLKARETGFDKHVTAEFLARQGLPYPWTKAVSEGNPAYYPCILKPKESAGAKGVIRIDTPEDAHYFGAKNPEDIWQELLGPLDQEYTCALFAMKGKIRDIQMRRVLAGGVTQRGEVVRIPEIGHLLERIAGGLDLEGSINVQLILTDRGPKVFEINPRFSSTVGFRDRLGFHDLLWSLDEPTAPWEPWEAVGRRFYRGTSEIII